MALPKLTLRVKLGLNVTLFTYFIDVRIINAAGRSGSYLCAIVCTFNKKRTWNKEIVEKR